MNSSPLILAVIVTYNGCSYIKKCLDRLKGSLDENCIIVVDNGSSDETATEVRRGYPRVTLIEMGSNHGFGRANNAGIEIALARQADYVFLVNQDVYVQDHTIGRLAETALFFPEYGILSPMHLNGKGNALDNHFAGYVSSVLISDLYLGTLKNVYPCNFVNAAAWLVSKKCLASVGGFDPLFFHYCEDDDYINRVRYFKMKIGVCPQAMVCHDRGTHNALSAYPEVRKIYLDVLKNLKDINYAFGKVLAIVLRRFIVQLLTCLIFFQFRKGYVLLQVFIRILFKLRRIRKARRQCMAGGAFIPSETPASVPHLPTI